MGRRVFESQYRRSARRPSEVRLMEGTLCLLGAVRGRQRLSKLKRMTNLIRIIERSWKRNGRCIETVLNTIPCNLEIINGNPNGQQNHQIFNLTMPPKIVPVKN